MENSEKIDAVEKYISLRIDKLEQLTEERFAAQQEALKIQAREYERRLETLNHEAAQLKSMQANYLPREVFERISEGQAEALKLLQSSKDFQNGRNLLFSSVVSALVALVVAVIAVLYGGK